MAKLHVLEEARHVSFAKTYLAESFETLDDARVARSPMPRPSSSGSSPISASIPPCTNTSASPTAPRWRANPNHRTTIVAGLAKLTNFLTEIGVIDQEHRPTWVELGLVD